MASHAAAIRGQSAHSFFGCEDEVLSEDSLVLSPEAKRSRDRARAGARSLSARPRKSPTSVTRPLGGRARSDTPPRPPRMAVTSAGAPAPVQRPHVVALAADTAEARLFALELQRAADHTVIDAMAAAINVLQVKNAHQEDGIGALTQACVSLRR